MSRLPVLLCLISLAAVLGGCGDGSGSVGSGGRAATEIQAGDQARAEHMILVLEDLPNGWTTDPSESNDETPIDACRPDQSDLTVTGEASDDQGRFAMDEVPAVFSDAVVLQTEADAALGFERISDAIHSDCFAKKLTQTIRQDAESGVAIGDAKVAELNLPTHGDEQAAVRISIPVSSDGVEVDAYLDWVFFRQDRAVGVYAAVDVITRFDEKETARLLGLMEARGAN
jgi:hypothetical protein